MSDDNDNIQIKFDSATISRQFEITRNDDRALYGINTGNGKEVYFTTKQKIRNLESTPRNRFKVLSSDSPNTKYVDLIDKKQPPITIRFPTDNSVEIKVNKSSKPVAVADKRPINSGSVNIKGEEYNEVAVKIGQFSFNIDLIDVEEDDDKNVDISDEIEYDEDDSLVDENAMEAVDAARKRLYFKAPVSKDDMLETNIPSVKRYIWFINSAIDLTDETVIDIYSGENFRIKDLKDILDEIRNDDEIVNQFELNQAKKVKKLTKWDEYKKRITNERNLDKNIGDLYVYESPNSLTTIGEVNVDVKDDKDEKDEIEENENDKDEEN